ncbi:MAG: pyridoxamine 5'-phosphate oxidase family protein [Defluviitaleaceae bacterium]|nr:pyridoxamine 5'-phosphate oxidase family protein [Defluviitaleaceae bacterium]
MYHADREIRDKKILTAMLDMCDVISIGFFDDEYPYVLPVNFGYQFEDDLIFYTHHAVAGYKNGLVEKNPKVCVTCHRFLDRVYNDYDKSNHDYRSVMAFGIFSFIKRESEDYAKAWEALCRCNGRTVPEAVFKPGFKVLMGKIVCKSENVIGKAQRSIKSVAEVPFRTAAE